MRLVFFLFNVILFFSCTKSYSDMTLPEPTELLYPGRSGIWKLSQYTDEYVITIEDTGTISGKAQFDFNYYCQRPINKLASRHAYCEEAGEPYLVSDQSYSYDDNFELVEILELSGEHSSTTRILKDEENKFNGIERYAHDGTISKPDILFNKNGQIIRVLNDFLRYDYIWKRDNLVRRDVYIKGGDSGVIRPENFYVLLPLCLNKSRIDLKRYREVKLLQARQILTSEAGGRDWLKVETEVYTYFDHLFPFYTLASGWPSTFSPYDLCTPVNDIKSWVTYLVNDKGEQTDVKTFELSFKLISKIGDLPTAESYIQKVHF